MGNIPEYRSSQRPIEGTPVRAATAEDFGGAVARGVGNVGQSLQNLGQVMERARAAHNKAELERVKAEHNAELDRFQFEAARNPDFINNPELYQKKSRQLQEDAQQRLGEIGMFEQYKTDMMVTYGRTGIAIDKDTVTKINDSAKVSLSNALNQYETSAARTADPAGQEYYRIQGIAAINRMQESGVLWPNEAETMRTEFVKGIRGAMAESLINEDPENALVHIEQRKGPFGEMTVDEINQYTEEATKEYRARLQFEQGQEDRQRREAERVQQALQDAAATVLSEKAAKNELTEQEVLARRNELGPDLFEHFLGVAVSGQSAVTNQDLYADLLIRAVNGEDVTQAAKAGLLSKNLDQADFNLLVDRSKANRGGGAVPRKFNRMEKIVSEGMKPSDLNPSVTARAAYTGALREMYDWQRANPEASEAQALSEARDIIQRFTIVDREQFRFAIGDPRYMVGERGTMDPVATLKATEEAFERKQISETQFLEEVRKIHQIQDIMNRQRNQAGEGE